MEVENNFDSIIKEKDEEIEKLKSTIEELQEICDHIPKEVKSDNTEIRELEERIAVYKNWYYTLIGPICI